MIRTCAYVEQGRVVHQVPATHVALESPRTPGPPHWDVYLAASLGRTCLPEFCLWHAMAVARDRNQAQQREQARHDKVVEG